MSLVKKCAHGRGKDRRGRVAAWRRCGCQWTADLRVEGVRQYVPLGSDEAKARVEYARLVADREAGRLEVARSGQRRDPGVREVALAWLASLEQRKKPPRQSSLVVYRTRANQVVAWFGEAPIGTVRSEDVEDFDRDMSAEYAPRYANEVYAVLCRTLRFAAAEGYIDRAPIPEGRQPLDAGDAPRMTIAEAERTIAHLDEPFRTMAELALIQGYRRGEILGLRVMDVDLDNDTVAIVEQLTPFGTRTDPKTANSRRVTGLTPRARELLEPLMEGKDPGDPLFDVTPEQASRHLRRAMKQAGTYVKGRGWHQYRHGATALLNQAGVSIRDAAAHLGHGPNFVQTMRYGWAAEVPNIGRVDSVRHAAASGGNGGPAQDEPPRRKSSRRG